MTKDQETKKLESESTMAEGTTESYVTMLLDENKRIVICKDHGVINSKNIIEQLARYCVTWIGEWMKILKDYKEDNWEVFFKEIIHEFHDQDITYKIYCQDYLQTITKKPCAWDGNIHIYVQEYTTIASTRLPEKLQNKIIDKAKLNLSDNMLPIDFRKVVQVIMDLINQYEGNKKVFKEDEMKQKKMEKLVEASKKTASFAKTEESKLKAKAKSSDSINIEAAIEKMTNKFINLALAMRVQLNQIQENSNQYYMLQKEEPPKPISNYSTNVTVNPTTVQENTQLPCYEYQSNMSNGYCHINNKENLHMGSKNQNYQAVTPKSGIPNMYIVQSMRENEWVIPELTSSKKKINQQEETSSANSTSMKVQAGQLAYLISDGESDLNKKYKPLKERTSVNIGTVGEAKNNQRAKIAMLHTQHTGQFITYQNNQASVDDDVMEDVELINQKKPEIQNKFMKKQRSRYSATDCLFFQICDSMDANELMGQILNRKVELSVKKLIDVSPKLH
ncbi:conserved hypothetical protein [Coccidioides posadasii str. Silveira]|uniref:Uncharacterized protein n=1 Tax=Coccidioides posadasii (strain RMSCC 757 / Silveira) TaxID=443226 RepID=E9CVB9_COCPS|nr:conserved hypothetical protein [Coccidioides posadasii str. Silveira]